MHSYQVFVILSTNNWFYWLKAIFIWNFLLTTIFLQDNRDVNFCGFSTLSCYFFIKIFVKHGHTVRSIGTASS